MMISFCEIPFEGLRPLVEFGFGDDPELLSKYQQFDSGFNEMVQRNLDNISGMAEICNLSHYSVSWEGETIGFTVLDLFDRMIFSFGVNVKFRTKEIVTAWYKKVDEIMEGKFGCILWNQNVRAIEFLERNGMHIIFTNETNTFLIKT